MPFDPIIALNAAVNRRTVEGQPAGGWLPSEKPSLADVLAAYGHGWAYAAFADGRRGTVKSAETPISWSLTAISSLEDPHPSSAPRWPSRSSAARSFIARRH